MSVSLDWIYQEVKYFISEKNREPEVIIVHPDTAIEITRELSIMSSMPVVEGSIKLFGIRVIRSFDVKRIEIH